MTPVLVPQLSSYEQRYNEVGGVLVLFLLLRQNNLKNYNLGVKGAHFRL